MVAMDIEGIGSYLTSGAGGMMNQVITWTGYILLAALIIGFLWLVYLWFQYKWKVDVYDLQGNESISRPKWERARKIKDKGTIKWKLLLRRKKIKPVDYDYIYPKRKVHLLRTSEDTFVPMEKYVDTEKKAVSLKPVDMDVSYWYQLQQQQIAKDYKPEDAAHKQMVIMISGFVIMTLFAGFVLWLAFTKTDALVQSMNQIAGKQSVFADMAKNIAPN